MSTKGYAYIALAVIVAVVLWRLGVAIHTSGAEGERAVWLAAQAEATEKADALRKDNQAASDTASDQTRVAANEGTQTARDETTTTIERIRYVYRDQVAADCPAVPVPDGVQQELSAAYDAARAAAR